MVFAEFDFKKKHVHSRVMIFSGGYLRVGEIRTSRVP